MDKNDYDASYTPNLPPSTAAEREAVYMATHDAIKSRNMKQAHHLLLKMIQVDGNNPELWLLLAWTAPTKREAGVFFEHLLQIQPDYPLAICGVAWSGIDWSAGDGSQPGLSQTGEVSPGTGQIGAQPADQHKGSTTGELGKKSLARQTGELASSVASLVSKPLKHKTGEIKPAPGTGDHIAPALKSAEIAPPADPHDQLFAQDLPLPQKQAEWLEPAAWSVNKEVHDYPFLDDERTGRRRRSKPLSIGWSGVGFAVFLGLYLLGLLSAELVTIYRSPLLGQAYYGILLILILLFAMFNSGSRNRKLMLALSLAPLARLISLSLPQLGTLFIGRYLIIGLIVLLAALVVYRVSGYKPGQVGLSPGRYLPLQLLVGIAGLGVGLVEYIILRPEPLINHFRPADVLLPAIVMFFIPGFVEEFIFRGLLQRAAAGMHKLVGPLYVSMLFAALHIGYKSWLDVVFLFLVGLVFSLVVEKTRSLFGVTLAHSLASISLFLVFPFLLAAPLKNLNLLPAPAAPQAGPAIWSAPGVVISYPLVITSPTATSTPTLAPATTEPVVLLPTLTTVPVWTLTATATSTTSPTVTVTLTIQPTRSPTATRTSTPTGIWYTRTPTPTSTRTPTVYYTPTLTDIPTATPTKTATPTITPTFTDTPVPTDILPEEPTATPTETPP